MSNILLCDNAYYIKMNCNVTIKVNLLILYQHSWLFLHTSDLDKQRKLNFNTKILF